MTQKIGIIGVGHFAGYLIEGFAQAGNCAALQLYSRTKTRAERLAAIHPKAQVFDSAQQAIDGASVIIVATRPGDVAAALDGLVFTKDQVVVSVAAGVKLGELQRLIGEAVAVRALPIACAAINKSPIVMMPENPAAQAVFAPLGTIHILQSEDQFTAGTALVGAFYALIFPLMGQMTDWAIDQGITPDMARALVVETVEGAAGMALRDKERSFEEIWTSLAVPGGISECGLRALDESGGLSAWSEAMDAITHKLKGGPVKSVPFEVTGGLK